MRHACRATGLGVALAALTLSAACTSASPEEKAAAELSAAATADPGEYGSPVNPSLPNPTDVATDDPVTVAPTDDGEVFITYAQWSNDTSAIEVGGYVAGVIEDDGTCTLTLTRGEVVVTGTVAGTPNASSTSCGGLSIPGNQLGTGHWNAVVTYDSSTSHGSSETVDVEVP
jgi:hypothetical protein